MHYKYYYTFYTSKFHQIFGIRDVWPWLHPPLTALQYVTYVQFSKRRHVFT